jgi:hypothetical protein
MDSQPVIFPPVASVRADQPKVIETSGVEVVELIADRLAVAPANMNGFAAPDAECVGARVRLIPFAATLRHIA